MSAVYRWLPSNYINENFLDLTFGGESEVQGAYLGLAPRKLQPGGSQGTVV